MKQIKDYKEYVDISTMVTGFNTLGYWNPGVDRTVKRWQYGTFNCPERAYLGKKLVELLPWAESDSNVC